MRRRSHAACWLVCSAAFAAAGHAESQCLVQSLSNGKFPTELREFVPRLDEPDFSADLCAAWKVRTPEAGPWAADPVADTRTRGWTILFRPGVLQCDGTACSVPDIRGVSMRVISAEERIDTANVTLNPNRIAPLLEDERVLYIAPSCGAFVPPPEAAPVSEAAAMAEATSLNDGPNLVLGPPEPGCEREDVLAWGMRDACVPAVPTKKPGDPSRTLVAVLDNGIDCKHNAIRRQTLHSGEPVPGNRRCPLAAGTNYVFENPRLPPDNCDNSPARRCDTHGTGVAGIIASGAPGLMGVDPNARLISMRILKPGYDLDLVDPLKLSTAILDSSSANVLNISANWYRDYPWIAAAVDRITGDGKHLVVASARKHKAAPAYPAAYTLCNDAVIGVASVIRKAGSTTEYDWWGNVVTTVPAYFVAPGGWILSPYSDGGDDPTYSYKGGTSFAAPHVSGAASLLWGTKEFASCSAPGIHEALACSARLTQVGGVTRKRLHLGCLFGQRNMASCEAARACIDEVKHAFCPGPALGP